MASNSASIIKLTPTQKFDFYLDHSDMPLEVLMVKLSLSERSIRAYKTRAKKLHKDIKKLPEESEEKEIKIIPDHITESYIEQEILQASTKEDLDRVKFMIDFLYKKDKFAKTEKKKVKMDIGDFLKDEFSGTGAV